MRFKYFAVVAIWAVIFLAGCDRSGGPSAPTEPFLVSPSSSSSAPEGVSTDPTPPSGGSETVGSTSSETEYSGQGLTSFDENGSRGSVSVSGAEGYVGLAVYEFVTAGGRQQRLVGLQEKTYLGKRDFTVRFPVRCETTYQSEFVREAPPEEIFDGNVPNIIHALNRSAGKWTSDKCVDECKGSRLNVDVELEEGEQEYTVVIRIDSSQPGNIKWVFDGRPGARGFGKGVTVIRESIPRGELDKVGKFTVKTDCDEHEDQIRIPRLPTCEEKYEPSASAITIDYAYKNNGRRKNPISCEVTVSRHGDWRLVLHAWDPGAFDKADDTVSQECEDGSTVLRVSYPWKGHKSQKWQCRLYRNGQVFGPPSALVDEN